MFGFTIGDKHTYDDFGLVMTSCYIPMPEPKVSKVDVPYRDGSIDLTTAISGRTIYQDRDGLKFEFVIEDGSYADWESIKSNIANHIHGKKLRLIMDNDRSYFYNVRLEVDSSKDYKLWGKIVLVGTAEPYKYDVTSSAEPWLWDPFNFYTGVITQEGSYDVSGTRNVTIPSGNMYVSPQLVVSNLVSTTFTVTYHGRSYNLTLGNNKIPAILINGDTEETLTFNGTATVQIVYRGGSL